MEKITPLTTTSNTLDTIAKLVRVMEKTKVTLEQLTLPINNRTARNNLADYLKAGCPKMETKSMEAEMPLFGYELASVILGKDFIRPDEIVANRPGVVYSDEQLESFQSTLPGREELEWLRDNGFVLVPGPARPMALLEIRSLKPECFYSKTGGWYANNKERFSREEKVATKWLKLRKEPLANSLNKNWSEQNELVASPMMVPNVAEMVWGLTTYKVVRDVYLLPNVYVRTSSVDSDGSHVFVGDFGDGGLNVSFYWAYRRYDYLGLASARK